MDVADQQVAIDEWQECDRQRATHRPDEENKGREAKRGPQGMEGLPWQEPQWRERLNDIPRLLKDKPSVVRLAYPPAQAGDPDLRKRRKHVVAEQIEAQWRALHGAYPLQVEDEAEDAR